MEKVRHTKRKGLRMLLMLSLFPFQQVVEPGKRITLRSALYTLRINLERNPESKRLQLEDIDLHLFSFDWIPSILKILPLHKKTQKENPAKKA